METYSSWVVISDKVVVKHCDLTALKHGLITIDRHLADYWGIKELTPNKKACVKLAFREKYSTSEIKATDKGQYRLYFPQNIRKYIKDNKRHYLEIDLIFEKEANNHYKVTPNLFNNLIDVYLDTLTSVITNVGEDGDYDGGKRLIYTTIFERKPKNRKEAIKIHGLNCAVCGFNFERTYGTKGKDFIEVHHVKPLHSLSEPIKINPKTDLVCLCSNCHRMIHHEQGKILTVDELRNLFIECTSQNLDDSNQSEL